MPKYHFYKQHDRSDCGATCLRMVCRYYGMMKLQLGSHVPTRGEILQDGHRLQEYRLTKWRECCGVAMSDGYIFSDTIANNIVLGRDEGDRNNMDAAVRRLASS